MKWETTNKTTYETGDITYLIDTTREKIEEDLLRLEIPYVVSLLTHVSIAYSRLPNGSFYMSSNMGVGGAKTNRSWTIHLPKKENLIYTPIEEIAAKVSKPHHAPTLVVTTVVFNVGLYTFEIPEVAKQKLGGSSFHDYANQIRHEKRIVLRYR